MLDTIVQAINELNKRIRSNQYPDLTPEEFLIEQGHHGDTMQSPLKPAGGALSVAMPNPQELGEIAISQSTSIKPFEQKEPKPSPSGVTFEQTALMIDQLFASVEGVKVLSFLQRHCPSAISKSGRSWVVASEFRRGEANVSEVLQQVNEQIRGFQGASSSDWRSVLNVVGGFLTFAIDPAWVEQQRLSPGNVQYPSKQRVVTFKDKKTADLMHLLTAAIAQGFPRLNRIYEGKSSEKHELVGPDIEREVVKSRRKDELKRSIIREIQHVNSIPRNLQKLSESRLQDLFEETQAIIKKANADRDPYFTWHEAYLNAVEILRSPEFDLKDLLLIFTEDDGLPIDLVSKPSKPAAWLFEYTHDIYQEIKQHLSSE